jgi:uncharacterized membrane protein YdjX (TVP38/TMEM64 family)
MSSTERTGGRIWIKIVILGLIVLAIFLVFQLTPLSISDFTPTNMKNFILKFGTWAPIVFVAIYSLRGILVVIPVGVMSLAGGLAFGQWFGTVYIIIGATIGSCLSFLVVRHLGRDFIERLGLLRGTRMKSFDEGAAKHGFRIIIFVRLIPLFQYDAVNFGAGLSKMKFRDFALASLIGMVPGGFVNAMLGSSLENIISVQFFAALGFFILLMFIPAIYKRLRKGEEKQVEKPESSQGACPQCGMKIGPIATIVSWENWGRFVCPGCGKRIRFRGWLLAVLIMMGLMVGVERILRLLLISDIPLWMSFTFSFAAALLVMFTVPLLWKFGEG